MEWLNEHSGLLIVIAAAVLIVLVAVVIFLLYNLHRKIAVQRLNFLGSYSADAETHAYYANLNIGNKSLNDVGIAELGIRNGRVNFDLTDAYRKKRELVPGTRIVIEQRSSVSFTLSSEELKKLVVEKNGKKIIKKLRLYAIDLTGNLYQGNINSVRKLLAETVALEKSGSKTEKV